MKTAKAKQEWGEREGSNWNHRYMWQRGVVWDFLWMLSNPANNAKNSVKKGYPLISWELWGIVSAHAKKKNVAPLLILSPDRCNMIFIDWKDNKSTLQDIPPSHHLYMTGRVTGCCPAQAQLCRSGLAIKAHWKRFAQHTFKPCVFKQYCHFLSITC